MKKLMILVALSMIFVLQLSVVGAKNSDNVDLNTKYHNMSNTSYQCGLSKKGVPMVKGIPDSLPRTISTIYKSIQIIVPVILVVMGSVDFIKAITSGKEDEIKKAQMTFIKRLIYGALVFFVLAIVKLVVSIAADSGSRTNRIIDCTDCFLNNKNCIKVSE